MFRLRLDDEKGKCLVATQDIKPLEVSLLSSGLRIRVKQPQIKIQPSRKKNRIVIRPPKKSDLDRSLDFLDECNCF